MSDYLFKRLIAPKAAQRRVLFELAPWPISASEISAFCPTPPTPDQGMDRAARAARFYFKTTEDSRFYPQGLRRPQGPPAEGDSSGDRPKGARPNCVASCSKAAMRFSVAG